MKALFLILFITITTFAFAQNSSEVNKLIQEGNTLDDSSRYKQAIVKFDSALLLDKNNLEAMIGKTNALVGRGEYYKTVDICEYILKKFKHSTGLKEVYINYADALNNTRKYSDGEKISSKGIELYPNNYRLYFCKAACLSNADKEDEAIPCYEKVITLDSGYSGAIALSNFTIGRILDDKGKHVQSLLALCKYIVEEPRSNRAKHALEMITEQMQGNAKKSGNGGMVVYVDKSMVEGKSKDGKPKENDFSKTSLILATMSIMNGLDTLLHQNEPQSFMRRFKVICSSLKDSQDSGFGFYWNYYGAYFIDMYKNDYLETFSNIIYLCVNNPDAEAWIKENDQKVKDFYKWSSSFTWKRS